MAAGLSIRDEQVGPFAEAFEAAVRNVTGPDDFIPETSIDAELRLRDVDDRLLTDLARLEPHGPSNPEPIFLARQVTVQSRRIVGENHLKLFLRQGNHALPAIRSAGRRSHRGRGDDRRPRLAGIQRVERNDDVALAPAGLPPRHPTGVSNPARGASASAWTDAGASVSRLPLVSWRLHVARRQPWTETTRF